MEFNKFKLSDISVLISKGSTPRGKLKYSSTGRIGFLRVTDLNDFDRITEAEYTLTEIEVQEYKMKLWPIDTVLVSIEGTIGKVSILEKEMTFNQAIAGIICNPNKLNPLFLMYYLKATKIFEKMIKGTIMPALRLGDISNLEIKLPSLEKQNKIVKILSDIDKKIELNNKINDNLYNLLVALYKKELLDNDNAETKTLDEFCNIFTGKKNANEFDEAGIYKFFTCGEKVLKINSFIHDGPAVIISGNGSYTGRTTFYNGKFDLYQRTYACTIKENINQDYIYGLYVIMKNELTKLISGGTHGSAIPYIVMDDLAKFKLKYEPKIFDSYSKNAKIMLNQIQNNKKENESLSKLRTVLLPKLINGEIDLDEIEELGD